MAGLSIKPRLAIKPRSVIKTRLAVERHPLTLRYLKARDLSVEGLKSQSWDDFEDEGLDLVITVCDSAASETCPLWMGETSRLHWGMPDPSRVEGSEQEVERAFYNVMDALDAKLSELRATIL